MLCNNGSSDTRIFSRFSGEARRSTERKASRSRPALYWIVASPLYNSRPKASAFGAARGATQIRSGRSNRILIGADHGDFTEPGNLPVAGRCERIEERRDDRAEVAQRTRVHAVHGVGVVVMHVGRAAAATGGDRGNANHGIAKIRIRGGAVAGPTRVPPLESGMVALGNPQDQRVLVGPEETA